jgi:uncharacterized protein (DUF1697 family)
MCNLHKNKGKIMKEYEHLALLRKINVGGNNVIKMNDLKTLFEEMGFTNVKTYIQSGNVLFSSFEKSTTKTKEKIDKELSGKINSKIKLLTLDEMKEIIIEKPELYGEENDKYRYTIIFLIDPLKAKDAIKEIKMRAGIDEIWDGKNVLYVSQLKSQMTKSYLTKIVGTSIYQNMTLRTWNVTKKLYELMEEKRIDKASKP